CADVKIVVEYEGTPSGWTVNLGDSSSNDGFGGGSGAVTENVAELQILDQTMTVFSSAISPGVVEQLWKQDVSLTDSAIKLVVKNQFLSWGGPHGTLQTPNLLALYAIPDISVNPAFEAGVSDGSKIFLGINRVISGPGNRTGTGARRVMITLK
ncbi:MAG: hypothetical protein ACUZ8H_12940, partial [Candidatus Anammoxibacter sp.]